MGKLGHSNYSVMRGILLASYGVGLLAFGAPRDAAAQSEAHRNFQQAVEDKQRYEAEEREKDRKLLLEVERMRADSQGRSGTPTRVTSSFATYQSHSVIADVDSLAGWNVPTYRLANGVILRASGEFRPDAPGVCIAHCQ